MYYLKVFSFSYAKWMGVSPFSKNICIPRYNESNINKLIRLINIEGDDITLALILIFCFIQKYNRTLLLLKFVFMYL